MKKVQVSSTPLPEVKVISKTGKVISTTYTKVINLQEPGDIVKISLNKNNILGTKKIGDDLVILNGKNQEITIENFFTAKGNDAHKIIIDDNGELFVSSYDTPFTGLNFAAVDSVESVVAGEGTANDAMWIAPLVALGVIGGGIAIASNDSSSGNGGNHQAGGNQEITNVVNQLNSQLTDITAAQATLNQSTTTLKDGATVVARAAFVLENTLAGDKASVEQAKTALEALMVEYQKSVDQLELLVNQFGPAAGNEAIAALAQAKALLIELQNDVTVAQNTIIVAEEVLTTLTQSENLVNSDIANTTLNNASLAKENPSVENIAQAQQSLDAYKQYITQLQDMQASLNLAITKAQDNQFTNQSVLNDLQNQLNEVTNLLNGAQTQQDNIQVIIDQAQESEALLSGAQEAIANAQAALDKASQDYQAAELALAEARAAMQAAAESNDLSKVAEINKQIDEANNALALAKQSYEDALSAYNDVSTVIDNALANGVSPDYVGLGGLGNISFNPNTDLSNIDAHLSVESAPSMIDVLKDFVLNSVEYFKGFFTALDGTLIGRHVDNVLDTVGEVTNSIIDKIVAPFTMIGSAWTAIKGLVGVGVDLTLDIGKVVLDSVTEAIYGFFEDIGDIVGGITTGIMDAVNDFWVSGQWWNTGVWFDTIYNGFKNVIGNVWSAITAIPGSAISKIMEKVKAVSGDLWDAMSDSWDIIATATSEITTVFYDNFIKSTIIWPVIDDLISIIGRPFTGIYELVTNLGTIFNILKDMLFKVPGDAITGIMDLFGDLFGTIGAGDKVVITGEVKALFDAMSTELTGDMAKSLDTQEIATKLATLEATEENAPVVTEKASDSIVIEASDLVFESLLSEGDANVNLDNVVAPEADMMDVANVEQANAINEVAELLGQAVLPQEEYYPAVAA